MTLKEYIEEARKFAVLSSKVAEENMSALLVGGSANGKNAYDIMTTITDNLVVAITAREAELNPPPAPQFVPPPGYKLVPVDEAEENSTQPAKG